MALVSFSQIFNEIQEALKPTMPRIRTMIKRSPAMAFTSINQVADNVGKKYGIQVQLNFPQRDKIFDFDSYGKENLSLYFDKSRKRFPIPRDEIKSKIIEILGDVQIEDAYMYEDKEGLRIRQDDGRIDILPHALLLWCKIDEDIITLCDWLLKSCYSSSSEASSTFSDINS